MRKIVFSSDELPAHLDDQARYNLWRDIYTANYGPCDMTRGQDRPFSAVFEFTLFGSVAVTRHATSMQHWVRTSHHVAADVRDDFLIGFNRSPSPPMLSQRGRELVVANGHPALFTNTEPVQAHADGNMSLIGVSVPRDQLSERVVDAQDLTLAPLDTSTPAARHLRRYLDFLLEPQDIGDDPALIAQIETTLVDLVTLALGAQRDSAEIARMRGLRAARVREILAAISAGFADPGFSAGRVALKLGLSPRYMQELLHETGTSFTERVTELRLQKARAMLADPQHDRRKVSDIGFACGFNEVSYFNRCFRRRFGASPTQFRGGNGGE